MLKKFLAFLGLASITLQDGKATVEMTEEQMEASGLIISERDEAIANVERLNAELEAAQSALAETQRQLDGANTRLQESSEENTRLQSELETLGNQASVETAQVKTQSNAVKTVDENPCITSESNDVLANIKAVQEAYL